MKFTWAPTLLFCFVFQACQSPENETASLKPGDLLFQDLNCGPMCDAIEAVTEGVDGKDFSHCAMVIERNDSLFAVEAIGSGVQLTPIENFYRRSGDTMEVKNITVGRVKAEYSNLIPQAIQFATQQVGQPYDDPFLLNNGRWYCSELLYESYKSANGGKDFFELFPMTFKNPSTNDFFPAWTEYYEELGDSIPEGEPGLNPGSISRSDKIEIVGE
ncbi:MAG: hypothetical protein HWE14_06975 [Flavobacteriia bacterium]|nr:hypothetical protein [Flavobacteriia bacterium]